MSKEIRLGLLFLVCEQDVHQPAVWREFTASAEGRTRLFCHPKYPLDAQSLLFGHEVRERHWTQWGGVSIVKAMLALLRAAVEGVELTHFLFASESCVPIKPWSSIEAALFDDPRSRIQWHTWPEMQHDHQVRQLQTCINVLFWRAHSQWVVLDRETSKFLLDHASSIDRFRHVPCADEHAIGTILAIHGYDPGKINRCATTWALWQGGMHPETIGSVTPQLRRQWQDFDGFCARKFSLRSNINSLKLHLFKLNI